MSYQYNNEAKGISFIQRNGEKCYFSRAINKNDNKNNNNNQQQQHQDIEYICNAVEINIPQSIINTNNITALIEEYEYQFVTKAVHYYNLLNLDTYSTTPIDGVTVHVNTMHHTKQQQQQQQQQNTPTDIIEQQHFALTIPNDKKQGFHHLLYYIK
eukprot:UN09860